MYVFICLTLFPHRLGSDVQLTAHTFQGFGKNFSKSIKQSPDALIQVRSSDVSILRALSTEH